MYKIKELRASKCIKFRCSEQICQRLNNKANVLGTMYNCTLNRFIFLWCLKDTPVCCNNGVKCPVAVKMEPDVQIPNKETLLLACIMLYSKCSLQKHQPETNQNHMKPQEPILSIQTSFPLEK